MAYTPNSPILTTDPQLLDTQALAAYVNRLGAYRSLETREYLILKAMDGELDG